MATTKKLSPRQLDVLEKACTHGHLEQDCRTSRDYVSLACTIASLRRNGLLDVINRPTELGRQTHASTLRPNAEVQADAACGGRACNDQLERD